MEELLIHTVCWCGEYRVEHPRRELDAFDCWSAFLGTVYGVAEKVSRPCAGSQALRTTLRRIFLHLTESLVSYEDKTKA